MQRRQLGTTGMTVHELGYGSMSLAIDRAKRPSEADAIALLRRMVDDLGIDFIDTADSYCAGEEEMGYCERLIARALDGGRRDRVVVATKGGFMRTGGNWIPNGRPDYLRAACERSLAALGTDRIDLYQFHRPDPQVPIEESLGALVDLRNEGKIRHIGVSNVSLEQLQRAMEITPIASLQNPLSFISFNQKNEDLLRFCEESGITWIAYAPLGGFRNAHRLTEFEEWFRTVIDDPSISVYAGALAWLLGVSPAVIPIPATLHYERLVENVRAADIRLTPEQMECFRHPRSWMHDYGDARGRNDLDAAYTALKKGLAFDAGDAMTWYNLACVDALRGNTGPALDALARAIDLGFAVRFSTPGQIRADADLASLIGNERFETLVPVAGATA